MRCSVTNVSTDRPRSSWLRCSIGSSVSRDSFCRVTRLAGRKCPNRCRISSFGHDILDSFENLSYQFQAPRERQGKALIRGPARGNHGGTACALLLVNNLGAAMPNAFSSANLNRQLRDRLLTAALLAPVLLFLLGCFIIPLGELLRLSFSSSSGAFEAYRELAGSEVYRRVFLNTLLLAFNVAMLSTLLAYPTAYLLSRLRGLALSIAFWCLLFPLWISVLVRTFAWVLLLERNGPLNRTLVGLGVIDEPLSLLFNTTGVYVGMVHVLLPYALLPIYTTICHVDVRLLQASDGLGAKPIQTFLRVYLPLTLPGVAAGFLLVFLLGLGFYVTPAILGGMHNLTISMLIDLFVTERLVWPLAAAGAFWLLLIVLVLIAVAGRFLNLTHTVAAR
jgi:ABC-type spermidine/putrescine transport system permease subunit I